MKVWAIAASFLLPGAAWAPDLLRAAYDARSDELVVSIAYRGTSPDHDFVVQWGRCRDGGVAGRLIDRQGGEPARSAFRVTQRLSLRDLPCRPAVVTLRLGRVSHMSVHVPG